MIQLFADWLTYQLLGLLPSSPLSQAVNFFIYDSLKILLLLVAITHLMSLIRYYLPIEKLRDFLAQHKFWGLDYFLATIFGAITPFCSCSSIPLFIGFLEAGIPLGVTFAFLITSPLVNEVALTLFIGLFGWQVTLVYGIAGILIGMVGGLVIGRLKLEKYVADFVWQVQLKKPITQEIQKKNNLKKIWKQISAEARGIIGKIWYYVLLGVGVGALIHGYVPQGFFDQYINSQNAWSVPLAVVLAVPLYSNASGVIPIVQSLVVKGIPLGTALAFMMATVGLSTPEALILKKVMKWQLLAIFFGVVTLGIILIGYGMNLIF